MTKKKVNELTDKDIRTIIQYPKTIGQHLDKDITLHIGQHSIYMKHDGKNYRLDKVKDHSLSSLSSLIK